jgi:tRNA(Ile)-lysidine synthetase-like protein
MAKTQPPAHHPFVASLARHLTRQCAVSEGDRLMVAVSGGADSVALLRGLAALAPRRKWQLTLAVGHVQHHRRASAETDAQFVETLAQALGLPFYRVDLAEPAQAPANAEAAMRRQRYAALAQLAEAFDAPNIATAHQADDQLETLLMRLMRGSSVRGLGGIRWRRRLAPTAEAGQPTGAAHTRRAPAGPMLIRPMLGSTRAQGRQFLEAIDQSWREDPTNADLTRWRARLRHEVLPVLRALQPDVPHKAVQLSGHFRALHRLLRREAGWHHERAVVDREASGQAVVDRGEARAMPRVVLAEVLRDLLSEAGAPPDRLTGRTLNPLIAAVRDTAGGCRRFDLPGGVTAWLTRSSLHIAGRA